MGNPFPGPWDTVHHPWLENMLDCKSELMIGQKAAQMGFTEVALNKCFFAIDIEGTSVLYVLPASTPDAKDFSTSRFDPALENCKHLQMLFTDVKNIHHKRAGFANLFIRGSRSRSQLKSIPAGLIILDEVDEMNQNNISLVFERVSGQVQKQIMMVSTPTIDNAGINYYYKQTTQEHYFFKCPHCSKWTELVYPDCLVITAETLIDTNIVNSHLICKECKGILDHNTKIDWLKGKWVPQFEDRLARGFYINQMYSMTVRPFELAQSFFRAQKDPADEQEFYNSKLGTTHIVEDAKLNDGLIEKCKGGYKQQEYPPPGSFLTIGVDVGKSLHYVVKQWFLKESITSDINTLTTCRNLKYGKVDHFEQLDLLVRRYRPAAVVVDANPERRKAYEFACRFPGLVKLCFYGRGVTGKQINTNEDEQTVTVDRTSWMDLTLGRYRAKTIQLPIDLDAEFIEHLKAPVRIYKKDMDGNPIGKYETGHEADHYAHADTYAEIALQLGMCLMRNEDIR